LILFIIFPSHNIYLVFDYEQKLSFRKQIARQRRTQYVEGIYGPKYYTVTLKSRWSLKITGNNH